MHTNLVLSGNSYRDNSNVKSYARYMVCLPDEGKGARWHTADLACLLTQVLEDVRGIIAEQLGTDLEKVNPDSKFVDLGADSLDTVEIMMALEEKFDLQLDEEGAEKISTVQVGMSAMQATFDPGRTYFGRERASPWLCSIVL